MTCGYCQLANSEEDHRCTRCGRRLTGSAPPAQAREHVHTEVRVMGANALAAAVARQVSPHETLHSAPRRMPILSMDAAETLDDLPRSSVKQASQPSLFGAELQPRLIPFESLPKTSGFIPEPASGQPRTAGAYSPPHPIFTPLTIKSPKTQSRRSAVTEDPQATLDFLPIKNPGRTLKTNAEAVIFCDASVAAPVHRVTAAALDLGMILAGYGTLLLTFEAIAKPAAFDGRTFFMLGIMLAVITLFYGLLFAMSGSVTPGMKWAHLRLITFDGFPLDGRSRALRFAGTWISFLSGGIGLLWALLDEENLTWQDHMSKTFPTLQESNSTVVRQARR